MFPLGAATDDHILVDFDVQPGIEGPQVVCTWALPTGELVELMLRRKQREYPRDISDGVELLHENTGLVSKTSLIDRGADLLAVNAVPGDSRWWYVRAWARPELPELALQFAGAAYTLIEDLAAFDAATTPALDLQQYPTFQVYVQNTGGKDLSVSVQSAPEDDDALWTAVSSAEVLLSGDTYTFDFSEASYKYVRARVTPTVAGPVDAKIWFTVNRQAGFFTSVDMQKPVLAYKTGRHAAHINDLALPELYLHIDRASEQALGLQLGVDATGEYFKLDEGSEPQGPMVRFLKIFTYELDRIHAYIEAIQQYSTDLDHMPPDVLQHVAFALGWSLEENSPFKRQRQELFAAAGFWKSKGSIALLKAVVLQVLNLVPRVQPGYGLISRAADPDLFRGE